MSRWVFGVILIGVVALALGACGGTPTPRHRIGSLPFPGPNTIYTLANPDNLGEHRYGIALGKPLSDAAEAQRGTLYTCQAGFLDVAHLRLTVDWMHFARTRFEPALRAGEPHVSFVGPDDTIVHAAISYPPVWDEIPEDARERALTDSLVRASARASYIIWTWHELITHEGHSSLALISEKGSAFGYDDMASHAVGLRIGEAVLRDERPHNEATTAHLADELERLGVVSKGQCATAVDAVRGQWWERSGPILRQFDVGLDSGRMAVHRVPGLSACEGVAGVMLDVPFGSADPVLQPGIELTIEPKTSTGRRIARRMGIERLDVADIIDAIGAVADEDSSVAQRGG